MYASEKEDNFRWIVKFVATRSSYTLTSNDLAPTSVQQDLSNLCQFAELAHGSMVPTLIWAHLPDLLQPGFPLEHYTYLADSLLVRTFHGSNSNLQGYIAYRPASTQLILSFSGTSSSLQAFQDLKVWKTTHPHAPPEHAPAAVHAGFWDMYTGVRDEALGAISDGITQHTDISEIVFTAHSMGGVMAYLLVLDLLLGRQTVLRLPFGIPLKIAVFDPFYLYHGKLYRIPPSECEHSIFNVEESSEGPAIPPDHPLGGHNYYGGRDMEKLQRMMRLAAHLGFGKDDAWKHSFLQRVKEDDDKWESKRNSRGFWPLRRSSSSLRA
ncbi:hypothetical protein FRB99_007996 [Tulasnella sp. 403]|nr:hypothetical protein FRB99_007996 [Tulasnella sp. 403]